MIKTYHQQMIMMFVQRHKIGRQLGKNTFWATGYQPIVISVPMRNQQVMLVPGKLTHS